MKMPSVTQWLRKVREHRLSRDWRVLLVIPVLLMSVGCAGKGWQYLPASS
jgi:hypothetical protein